MPDPTVKTIKSHRRLGPIPRLKGNAFPKEFIFFDTETYTNMITETKMVFPMRLGIAIYVRIDKDHNVIKRRVLDFNTANDFIDILRTYCTGKKTIYVLAHNIKFDIMVLNLPMSLAKRSFTSKLPIINERMFIWNATINNGKAVFIDTANYCVISVEQLGNDLGKPKGIVDFTNVSDDELRKYCVNDVEILEEFVLAYVKFISDNQLGTFKMTLASQSLTAWRRRFMFKTVVIHDNWRALSLERKSYHGGRTECFYIGEAPEQDYYYVDVNSMYPFIMKESRVPTVLLKQILTTDLDKLQKCVNKYYVIADVEIDTLLPAYPLVHKDKLLFPIGKFRTVLHHRELSYALQHDHITKVHRICVYDHAPIFGHYVDFFYALKKQTKIDGNKSWNIISKYFLNSLYGKMAQTGVIQEIVPGEYKMIIERTQGHELHTFNYPSEINWFGTIIRETRKGESSYSFPACAGAITANARMYLWSLIECADRQNVYYCDTDSLIVNKQGYDNLAPFLNNDTLGMLKLEKSSPFMHIFGAKDYAFGSDFKHKGISPKAKYLGRFKWQALQFGGIFPWMNEGTSVLPSAKYIVKQRKEDYRKGVVASDGYVTPLIFPIKTD